MITGLQGCDTFTNLDHNARAFMAKDGRKQAFGIGTGAREFIGVADARRLDFDQNLAGTRAVQIDFHHLQRLPCRHCHCCSCAHVKLSLLR